MWPIIGLCDRHQQACFLIPREPHWFTSQVDQLLDISGSWSFVTVSTGTLAEFPGDTSARCSRGRSLGSAWAREQGPLHPCGGFTHNTWIVFSSCRSNALTSCRFDLNFCHVMNGSESPHVFLSIWFNKLFSIKWKFLISEKQKYILVATIGVVIMKILKVVKSIL